KTEALPNDGSRVLRQHQVRSGTRSIPLGPAAACGRMASASRTPPRRAPADPAAPDDLPVPGPSGPSLAAQGPGPGGPCRESPPPPAVLIAPAGSNPDAAPDGPPGARRRRRHQAAGVADGDVAGADWRIRPEAWG